MQLRHDLTAQVSHFRGGPCDAGSIACCLAVGGTGRGWSIVEGDDALVRGTSATHTCARSLGHPHVRARNLRALVRATHICA
eukprot:186775-Prymnesium_polylepis.1